MSTSTHPYDPAKVRHDALGDLGTVHRVDVHGVDAVGEKVDDLLRRVGDARVEHRVGMVAEAVDDRLEPARQVGAGEAADAPDLAAVRDGHDARDHGHGHAARAELREIAVEDVVVEEHLRGHEVEPSVHLLLEVFDVVVHVRAVGMALRVARAAEAEAT